LIHLKYSTFTLKYIEVLFQQAIFIYILTVTLSSFADFEKILIFTLIGAILHLGNHFYIRKKISFIFTVLSIPMGILFGYLIINGLFLVTNTIHLGFYLCFVTYLRRTQSNSKS